MPAITLTEANDEGFDAKALGVDLEKLSNVRIYCVTKVKEIIKEGFLHYVNLEFTDGDIVNPDSDPLIFCTLIKRTDESNTTHCEMRAIWNNKLWRILDDDASSLLELLAGIKKSDVDNFVDKLFRDKTLDKTLHTNIADVTINSLQTSKWKKYSYGDKGNK